MTPKQMLEQLIARTYEDINERGTSSYHSIYVINMLKDIKDSILSEAQPVNPSPAAQQLITKVMPIRDQIACMAMQGFLSSTTSELSKSRVAIEAYEFADAMIKEGKIKI